MAGFVNLGWSVDSVLDTLPDEVEAALEDCFYLSNGGMDRIVDCIKELCNLADTEQYISVDYELDSNLARSERAAMEGCVPCVCEGIAARGTTDAETIVPGLYGGPTTLRTGSIFPRLLAAPLDLRIKRLWSQHV